MIHQNYNPRAAQAKYYFNNLFPKLDAGERIEVRYKPPDAGQMRRIFFENLNEALDEALALGQSQEVYVGVAPRQGNVGTKEGVTRLFALWADLDAKGEYTSQKRMDQIEGGVNPIFRTEPIVNFCPSGHVTPQILPGVDTRGWSVISSGCRPPL